MYTHEKYNFKCSFVFFSKLTGKNGYRELLAIPKSEHLELLPFSQLTNASYSITRCSLKRLVATPSIVSGTKTQIGMFSRPATG